MYLPETLCAWASHRNCAKTPTIDTTTFNITDQHCGNGGGWNISWQKRSPLSFKCTRVIDPGSRLGHVMASRLTATTLMWWFAAWRQQVITWTNVSSSSITRWHVPEGYFKQYATADNHQNYPKTYLYKISFTSSVCQWAKLLPCRYLFTALSRL